ncbi:Vacuolar membrane protein [Pleurotus pulmonarius]
MALARNVLLRTAESALERYPDIDKKSCALLGPTALIVQGLMGVLVILSLVYKRQRETAKRPWRIWLFDVSKQVVGQMFVHGVNVLVSDLISHHSSANACVSYFLNILIDTTLGIALIYLFLHSFTYILTEKFHLKGFESGKYGRPPSFKYWLKQATTYVLALTSMKFVVLTIFAVFPGIFKFGEWLLGWTWTGEGDALQVTFVMGIFPIAMNILQFWLIDSIVKASSTTSPLALETDADGADREPLFRGSMDDEDDDNDDGPGRDIENRRHRVRSPSRSPARSRDRQKSSSSTSLTTPFENKSSGSSTTSQAMELRELAASTSHSSSDSVSSLSGPNQLSTRLKGRLTDSDDWATRVGEEDWTGRRLELKKHSLLGGWEFTAPSIQVGS